MREKERIKVQWKAVKREVVELKTIKEVTAGKIKASVLPCSVTVENGSRMIRQKSFT